MLASTPIPRQLFAILSVLLPCSISASKEDLCDPPANTTASSLLQVKKTPPQMTIFTVTSHVVSHDQTKLGSCIPPTESALWAKEAKLSKVAKRSQVAVDSSAPPSFIHDVVGANGVLQISLQRSAERAAYSSTELQSVGIVPTSFPATDVECTPQHLLDEACNENCSPDEAAILHSHKRALEFALQRDHQWTAILEDDAVPVLVGGITPGSWDGELRRIWSTKPANAKIIRLSWCTPNTEDWSLAWIKPFGEGLMTLTQFAVENKKAQIWNSVGLCTTAYVVHRDIIPELLNTFPCNCALDACLGWKFFNAVDGTGVPYSSYLYNLNIKGSEDLAWAIEQGHTMNWYGVLRQAHEKLSTTVAERAQLLQK